MIKEIIHLTLLFFYVASSIWAAFSDSGTVVLDLSCSSLSFHL